MKKTITVFLALLFCVIMAACGSANKNAATENTTTTESTTKSTTAPTTEPVKKDWIEDLVVRNTMGMITNDEMIEAIISQSLELQERENAALPYYEQQLRETDAAIENLLNAIQQGILTKSTKTRLEQLEATKEELEYNISVERLVKPRLTYDHLYRYLIRFRTLDMKKLEHRKMLIDTFVNAVYLFDDKVVITFNYKDGSKTITFSEMNAALSEQHPGSDMNCCGAPYRVFLQQLRL